MKALKDTLEKQKASKFTNEEINEVAEWLEDLSLSQLFFLKQSYEAYLNMAAYEHGCDNVH